MIKSIKRLNNFFIANAIAGFLLFVFVFYPSNSPAQNTSVSVVEANFLFEEGKYTEAVPLYEQLHDRNPENVTIAFRLAESYRNIRFYDKAINAYQDVLELDVPEYLHARFWYATVLKLTGNYVDAEIEFKKYAYDEGNRRDNMYVKQALSEIRACTLADSLQQFPLPVTVENAGSNINSTYSDFAAISLGANSIIFTSTRPDTGRSKDLTIKNGRNAHLFQTEKTGSGWALARKIAELDNEQQITGDGTFSPDGTKFFFTQAQEQQGKIIQCFLYVSTFNNGNWLPPEVLNSDINLPGYVTTQPALAPGKNGREMLYFVSNRPGGFGGNDIWFSTISKEGIYSKPENCGNGINTEENEASPFYHQRTRSLYFSSEGHTGFGGYDMFRSEGSGAKWGDVENLGYPLNSCADDLFFTTSLSMEDGFFTSNRAGSATGYGQTATCCDDIYSFKWVVAPPAKAIITLTGEVRDIFSKEPIPNAEILIVNDEKGEEIEKNTSGLDGNFLFDLHSEQHFKIRASKDKYIALLKSVSTKGSRDGDTVHLNFLLERSLVEVGQVLRSVYFDFGQTMLTPRMLPLLDSIALILKQSPSIIVEIGAHTDNKGTESFNAGLSQTRALNIIEFFIKTGIERKRLIFHSYGESKPIAPNTNPDGSDNPAGRSLNRRTEIKVLEIKPREE